MLLEMVEIAASFMMLAVKLTPDEQALLGFLESASGSFFCG